MPARLPDEERQRIVDLLGTGKSCQRHRQGGRTAAQYRVRNRTGSTGSRFRQYKRLHARPEANSAYGAEWRADFAKRLSAECDSFLENLHGEYLVYNFGGKDNDYAEHTLDEPPTEAKLKTAQAIRLSLQSIMDILRHDSDGGLGLPAVDEWLETVRGTKA